MSMMMARAPCDREPRSWYRQAALPGGKGSRGRGRYYHGDQKRNLHILSTSAMSSSWQLLNFLMMVGIAPTICADRTLMPRWLFGARDTCESRKSLDVRYLHRRGRLSGWSNLFVGVDVRRGIIGQHPRAHRTGRTDIELLHASFPGRGEGYRTACAHHLDRLSFWRAASMVHLRRSGQWTIL
jgi:hypothetical protein